MLPCLSYSLMQNRCLACMVWMRLMLMQVIWKLVARRFHVAVLSRVAAIRVLAMHFDLQPVCAHFVVAVAAIEKRKLLAKPTKGFGSFNKTWPSGEAWRVEVCIWTLKLEEDGGLIEVSFFP
ncbi:uncharacterized protein LOC127125478 isoform X2 [Lathyrus oleraceus]|nr:uncharacterized protein LOC127125478 isoform X2 [Pisum sativum]XP_050910221.1 uncharacterized protein LOC127125478 isoform X2 [Pisum sativum]